MNVYNNQFDAIILLSGGLDSFANLAIESVEAGGAILGLNIDYGQSAAVPEKYAAARQAEHFGVAIEYIKLDWYARLLPATLRSGEGLNINGDYPDENDDGAVWAPNRNGLLLAIAGAYADATGANRIIPGFNAEEAATFADNSSQFINDYNRTLKSSVRGDISIICHTIEMDKTEIVKWALEHNAPLELVYSCYKGGERMCGGCASCIRLKNALSKNNVYEQYGYLFRD